MEESCSSASPPEARQPMLNHGFSPLNLERVNFEKHKHQSLISACQLGDLKKVKRLCQHQLETKIAFVFLAENRLAENRLAENRELLAAAIWGLNTKIILHLEECFGGAADGVWEELLKIGFRESLFCEISSLLENPSWEALERWFLDNAGTPAISVYELRYGKWPSEQDFVELPSSLKIAGTPIFKRLETGARKTIQKIAGMLTETRTFLQKKGCCEPQGKVWGQDLTGMGMLTSRATFKSELDEVLGEYAACSDKEVSKLFYQNFERMFVRHAAAMSVQYLFSKVIDKLMEMRSASGLVSPRFLEVLRSLGRCLKDDKAAVKQLICFINEMVVNFHSLQDQNVAAYFGFKGSILYSNEKFREFLFIATKDFEEFVSKADKAETARRMEEIYNTNDESISVSANTYSVEGEKKKFCWATQKVCVGDGNISRLLGYFYYGEVYEITPHQRIIPDCLTMLQRGSNSKQKVVAIQALFELGFRKFRRKADAIQPILLELLKKDTHKSVKQAAIKLLALFLPMGEHIIRHFFQRQYYCMLNFNRIFFI